jgi:hypothetical protein
MDTISELMPTSSGVSPLRTCPFCAGAGEFIGDPDSPGVGVRCARCGASIPAIHAARKEATAIWNRRYGSATSLSALGGAATRGLSTPRKRAASRRNLKRARQQKKLNRIKAGIEASYARLKEARTAEEAEAVAAATGSCARLAELEPLILADPVLRRAWELLRKRRQADD